MIIIIYILLFTVGGICILHRLHVQEMIQNAEDARARIVKIVSVSKVSSLRRRQEESVRGQKGSRSPHDDVIIMATAFCAGVLGKPACVDTAACYE